MLTFCTYPESTPISLGSGPNGADLLREVKAREDIEDVPAIALTAYAMPGDREELLDEGFEECRQPRLQQSAA